MSQGVRIINNVHIGYKAIVPSDTVPVPAPYNDGFLVLVAGNVVFNTRDVGGDDVTLAYGIGDVWYVQLNLVKATGTTATLKGIRINN
jgi:hypothetical protein